MVSLTTNTISLSSFKEILSRYPSTVPPNLLELDTLRYSTTPASLSTRKTNSDAYLEKSEVEKLVEWKLKHGTFRPKLLQLVQSNSGEVVEETTRKAFGEAEIAGKGALVGLKTLISLKGIGPATASLLLSVYNPDNIPFFSDEVFRWCMWDESGKPGGWSRPIKYNVKEYEALLGRVGELVQRLEVRAVDIERVAWVLGKEGVDVGVEEGLANRNGEGEKRAEEMVQKKVAKRESLGVKKGAKRRMEDADTSTKDVRRSNRRKVET